MATRRFKKSRPLIGVGTSCLLLAGCGGIDGVELNGGVFDALGVSSKAQSARQRERTVAARPGIVMPPDTTRLPAPGSAPTPVAPQDASWPVGPEDREQQQQAALKRQHDAFCKEAELRRATAETGAEPEIGPLGSCKPGLGEMIFGSQAKPQ